MGNVHLKWAFSEAAVLFLCHNAEGRHLLAQIQTKQGKGKALSILAHKIGRDLRHAGARDGVFDGEVSPRVAGRRAERRAGEPVVSLEPRD